MIPGALLGLGCGLLCQHASHLRGLACAVAGLGPRPLHRVAILPVHGRLTASPISSSTSLELKPLTHGHDRGRRVLCVLAGQGCGLPIAPRRRAQALADVDEARYFRPRSDRRCQGGRAMSTLSPDRAASRSDDEALTAQQMKQAEELLFSEPPREGFAKALFRGEFRGDILFPYPRAARSRSATAVENAVAAVRVFAQSHIDPAAIDREADIPRSVIDGLGRARRAGHDRAGRVRRPRVLAAGLLPDHGGHRRPLLLDGRVRQRPSLDRHPRAVALRHARAEGAVAAAADARREAGGLRPDRGAGRLRRLQRPDDGHAHGRRPDLHPQRDQALHHQRRRSPTS